MIQGDVLYIVVCELCKNDCRCSIPVHLGIRTLGNWAWPLSRSSELELLYVLCNILGGYAHSRSTLGCMIGCGGVGGEVGVMVMLVRMVIGGGGGGGERSQYPCIGEVGGGRVCGGGAGGGGGAGERGVQRGEVGGGGEAHGGEVGIGGPTGGGRGTEGGVGVVHQVVRLVGHWHVAGVEAAVGDKGRVGGVFG